MLRSRPRGNLGVESPCVQNPDIEAPAKSQREDGIRWEASGKASRVVQHMHALIPVMNVMPAFDYST
jgi:hypothetical protein